MNHKLLYNERKRVLHALYNTPKYITESCLYTSDRQLVHYFDLPVYDFPIAPMNRKLAIDNITIRKLANYNIIMLARSKDSELHSDPNRLNVHVRAGLT